MKAFETLSIKQMCELILSDSLYFFDENEKD